jgi:hypothetical protein
MSSSQDLILEDPNQLDKVGLALWKMHIQNDEAMVTKQQQFLSQLLNKKK